MRPVDRETYGRLQIILAHSCLKQKPVGMFSDPSPKPAVMLHYDIARMEAQVTISLPCAPLPNTLKSKKLGGAQFGFTPETFWMLIARYSMVCRSIPLPTDEKSNAPSYVRLTKESPSKRPSSILACFSKIVERLAPEQGPRSQ
jgi:hypothetical protein